MTPRAASMLSVVIAVVLIALLAALRVPLTLIATLAVLVIAGGGLAALSIETQEPRLPDPRSELRGGVRRDVSQAAFELQDKNGRAGAKGAERLRLVAAQRLARHGVDLFDSDDRDRAVALLGEPAYRVVSRPAPQPFSVLRETIAAIDRLDEIPRRAP